MSRGNSVVKRRLTEPDHRYNSRLINLLINRILKSGKKSIAQRIVYKAITLAGKRARRNPMWVLEHAIKNVTPKVGVKLRRVRGSLRPIPIEIRTNRGTKLSIRWISEAAKKRPGKGIAIKLSNELSAACIKQGIAIKKCREAYQMAAANKAFIYFGRKQQPYWWKMKARQQLRLEQFEAGKKKWDEIDKERAKSALEKEKLPQKEEMTKKTGKFFPR